MQKIAKIFKNNEKWLFYNFLLHILSFVSIFIFSLIKFVACMPGQVVFWKYMPCRSKKDKKINGG